MSVSHHLYIACLPAWLVRQGTGGGSYHKVTLDICQLVRQLLLIGIVDRAIDLVVVVVQTRDVCTRELGDLSRGTTDTTANVENLRTLLDVDLVCEVVFMAGNGLVEGLADREAAEMEGLAPTVLVDVGSKVVVTVTRGGTLVEALIDPLE